MSSNQNPNRMKFCKNCANSSKGTGLNKSQRSSYPTTGFDMSYPSLMKVVSPVAPARWSEKNYSSEWCISTSWDRQNEMEMSRFGLVAVYWHTHWTVCEELRSMRPQEESKRFTSCSSSASTMTGETVAPATGGHLRWGSTCTSQPEVLNHSPWSSQQMAWDRGNEFDNVVHYQHSGQDVYTMGASRVHCDGQRTSIYIWGIHTIPQEPRTMASNIT